MLHLLDKVLYMAVKAVLSVALAFGVLLNPVFDDVISLNRQVAAIRDETLAVLPCDLIGRPTEAPHTGRQSGDEVQRLELRFAYGPDVIRLPVTVTQEDMRYDTDISSAWVGSNFERTRRVSLYIDEYSRSPMISDMCQHLRKVRHNLDLDRNEYAELIITMVQRLPYDSPPGTFMRAPVRVVLDGAGDCDERAFLAASLLEHEGYDTALLEFDREEHAALGLRTHVAESFPGTDYAFVEMTEELPIGEWAAVQTAAGPDVELTSAPLVIPLGRELHASR